MELEEVFGLNPVEGIDDLDEILNFEGPIIKESNTKYEKSHDIFSGVFHKTEDFEHKQIITNNLLSQNNVNNCTEVMFDTQKNDCDNTINTTVNVFPMLKTEFITSLCFDKISEQQNTQFFHLYKKEEPSPNLSFLESFAENQQISSNPTQFSLGLSFLQRSNDDDYSYSVKGNPQLVPVNFTKDISLIPKSVLKLYQIVRESFSDFAFVYSISAQMCQDFLPMDSFVNLKMGLLLSLASIENDNKRMPLPIIAFGRDSSSTNAVMNHFGNISKRFISPLDEFQSVSIGRDNMIEAGPMLLAKGGVCYLGDWSRIKPGPAGKILKELESGQALVDKMQIAFPIQSAVWSYWSAFKNTSKDINTLSTLLDIFGIPIIVENCTDEVLIDFLLDETCTLATKPSEEDELTIPTYDMKEYLTIVSRRSVDMTTEANKLLQKYFIASRSNRPNCLTQKSFITLQQLSESFAKLSFRHEVISVDVIAAIYLAENFIHNIFGPGFDPAPQLSANNYVGEVDNFIKYFEQWLQQYIEKFASDL